MGKQSWLPVMGDVAATAVPEVSRGRLRRSGQSRSGVGTRPSLRPDRRIGVWADVRYVDDETNVRRRRVFGSHCYPGGPELTEDIAAAVRGVSALGMTPGAGARRLPYRREPYGRAWIATALGELVVDGKVLLTEDGPLVELWRHYASGRVLHAYIPAAWVRRISRDESAWVDVYDILEG